MRLYESYCKNMTNSEIIKLCQTILKASGDRAWVISLAKKNGWWKDEVAEPCQAILDAPGDRALAIFYAKSQGWWKDEIAEPCQAILNAPGNQAYAISLAKSKGWWKDEVVEPCQAILEAPGDQATAIDHAKKNGWWRDPSLLDKNRYFSFTANTVDCGFVKILNVGVVCEKYPSKECVERVFRDCFKISGDIVIVGMFEFKNKQDYVDFYLDGDRSKLEQ